MARGEDGDAPAEAQQYNVEALVPDWGEYMARYAAESERVKATMPGRLDVAYGPHELQKLDIFAPEGAGSPIQLYIHGGGWRASDKAGRAYPAEPFVAAGAVWAPINYRLAPDASLDEIVHDVRQAVAWVYENAAGFGGDRERIFVSGNSAGGHLSGTLMMEGWEREFGLPQGVVKGACAISGVFDMTTLMKAAANEWLAMDSDTALRNSPIRHLPASGGGPLIVAYGAVESDAFKFQSREYAAAWGARGYPVRELELADHNHFSIMGELAHEGGELFDAMLRQMGIGGAA